MVHGISPGQRILVFGQKMVPLTSVVPSSANPGESVRVSLPAHYDARVGVDAS